MSREKTYVFTEKEINSILTILSKVPLQYSYEPFNIVKTVLESQSKDINED
jgi:hypothetical protein